MFTPSSTSNSTHSVISPAILYFGTPVAILSSENEDGTSNLCPMSSVWWLGHRCMLGLDKSSKTTQNILRTGQCVINLPDESMVDAINALATTTGSDPVSDSKKSRNYRFVKDKWSVANLTPMESQLVRPQRVKECPVQMECELATSHLVMEDLYGEAAPIVSLEMRVCRIHIHDNLRMEGYSNKVDPDKWRPMIMSFQEFYGLKGSKKGPSDLGMIDEEQYRALTVDDAKKTVERLENGQAKE
ncbi:hypothetical protein BDV96DRAFT_591320 [Lophiotrema nucula]|uniref:Flavin reductase like domain-containing protein n=1 Tax=Lophiotrema nucula TaxID=690887 RepID=A0A6A5YGU4_9PLEO|nr:hypothetical protein BDV96DRAFT_591320 [Lophiotrema nucula]